VKCKTVKWRRCVIPPLADRKGGKNFKVLEIIGAIFDDETFQALLATIESRLPNLRRLKLWCEFRLTGGIVRDWKVDLPSLEKFEIFGDPRFNEVARLFLEKASLRTIGVKMISCINASPV
jgi:hypothetical protein